MSRRFDTASGGVALESDDGRSGAVETGDGRRYKWGADGAILLAELADELKREDGIERNLLSGFIGAGAGERPDQTLHVQLSAGDASGLTDGARRLLEADGVTAPRNRTGSAQHEAAVAEVQAKLDPHNRGRPIGHDAVVAETAKRLDHRRRSAGDEAAIADARARLTRRPGEVARRNRPSDPADWRGTEVESEAARKAIAGRLGEPGVKPKVEPPERRQEPTSGQGWAHLKAHAGRPKSGVDVGLPPSWRRRAR